MIVIYMIAIYWKATFYLRVENLNCVWLSNFSCGRKMTDG